MKNGLFTGLSFLTEDGFKLGSWVDRQRSKKENMRPERKKKLNLLGFEW